MNIQIIISILLTLIACSSEKKESRMNEHYKSEGLGQIERHDFNKSIREQIDTSFYNKDWNVSVGENQALYIYAPAIYFYMLRKEYHPNGMIKERGKYMCNLRFGKWEYFDEKGNLVKVIDEDAKFKGVEMTREDVLKILEKEGWFNRKTGEQNVSMNYEKIIGTTICTCERKKVGFNNYEFRECL